MITEAIRKSIDKSVLCWLATTDADGMPNVSPKEIFCQYGTGEIIIANIASPQSVKNIKMNNKVCLSFIDVLVQKGYQLKGIAEVIGKTNEAFPEMEALLLAMTQGKFPFSTLTKITIEKVKPIIAPRYLFFPETTEADQIQSAIENYRID